MQLVVTPAGNIRCLYAEAIPLTNLGTLAIARGSYVEPTVTGEWHADLAPVNGPVLGPFATRSAALDSRRCLIIDCEDLLRSRAGFVPWSAFFVS